MNNYNDTGIKWTIYGAQLFLTDNQGKKWELYRPRIKPGSMPLSVAMEIARDPRPHGKKFMNVSQREVAHAVLVRCGFAHHARVIAGWLDVENVL